LANAIEELLTDKSVIVAPDLGAVKLAERYGELLRRPIAIAHKTRLSGEEVRVRGIVGEVGGRAPIIVDDMISTGGTIEAAAAALIAAGCLPEITVVWGMGRKTVLGVANCAEVETPAAASPNAPMLNTPKSRR